MPFEERSFKGGKVYVEVDEAGELVLEDGRARMKYKLDDERIYSPWPGNLEPAGAKRKPSKPKSKRSAKASSSAAGGDPPQGAIVAYTDGGCIGNPGPAGLGYAILFPDGRRVQRGEPLGEGTNNVAELTAIARVLEIVGDTDGPLVIHTDSEYAIGVLTKGWKAKANQRLIGRIRSALARFPTLELRKVPGHAGVPENELVDDLARTAAETQSPVEELDSSTADSPARTRVAVSGIGAVCAAGRDVPSLLAALRSPARTFGPNRRHALLDFAVTVGEAPDEWFAEHDHPALDSPTGRLCLAAARECVECARAGGAPAPAGLAVGTSTGGQSRNEEVVFGLLDGDGPTTFDYSGQGCMAAPTRLVARDLGIVGPVQTVSTACTSSANSIALGAAWIRSGRVRSVLVGGGDALCHTTIASFRALELTGPEMCTPFGPDRPGLTLGEGAGFLLLERLDDVLGTGREPLAELLGAGISSDAHHMTAPPADGAGAEAAMRRALQDAGIEPTAVDHVNAHGTGTRLNDAAEASAIARVFGGDTPVMSCKGLCGHTLGGAGGLEAVAAVLAVRERRAFENLGAHRADEDCPVELVGPGGRELGDHSLVLSNSFAFGGNNCALVLGAARGRE